MTNMKKYLITCLEERSVTVDIAGDQVDTNIVTDIDIKMGTFDDVESIIPKYTNSIQDTQNRIDQLAQNGRVQICMRPYPEISYYKTVTIQEF